MKAYPNYSMTPLPWLPNIPAHWELVRNKNIFEEVKDVIGNNTLLFTVGLMERQIKRSCNTAFNVLMCF